MQFFDSVVVCFVILLTNCASYILHNGTLFVVRCLFSAVGCFFFYCLC